MRAPKAASSTSSSRTRYGRTTCRPAAGHSAAGDRKSTRLNSSHGYISYAVFCLKKKINTTISYSHIKDFRSSIIDTTEKNSVYTTIQNLASQHIINLNFSAPIELATWCNVFLHA